MNTNANIPVLESCLSFYKEYQTMCTTFFGSNPAHKCLDRADLLFIKCQEHHLLVKHNINASPLQDKIVHKSLTFHRM